MIDLHACIDVRAYHLWEAAGRPEGQHEIHWLAAERIEIEAEARRAAEQAKAAKRSAAAKKGAVTRAANRVAKREADSRVVASILGRSTAPDAAARATAH